MPRKKRISSDQRLAVTKMEFIEVEKPEDFVKQVKSIKGRMSKFFWIGAFTADSFESCIRKVICQKIVKGQDVDKTFTHCFVARTNNVKFKSDWILNITGLGLRTKKITAKLAPGYLFLLQKLDPGTVTNRGTVKATLPGLPNQNVLALNNKAQRRKRRVPSKLPKMMMSNKSKPMSKSRLKPKPRTQLPPQQLSSDEAEPVRRRTPRKRRNEYLTEEELDVLDGPRKRQRKTPRRARSPAQLLDEAGIPMEPSQEIVEGISRDHQSPPPYEPVGIIGQGMKTVDVKSFVGHGRKRRTPQSRMRRSPKSFRKTRQLATQPAETTYVGNTACSVPTVPFARSVRKGRGRMAFVKKHHLKGKTIPTAKPIAKPKSAVISSSKGGAKGVSRLSSRPKPKSKNPRNATGQAGLQWVDEDVDLTSRLQDGDLGEETDFSD